MKGRYELLSNVGDGWAAAALRSDLNSVGESHSEDITWDQEIRRRSGGRVFRGIEVRVDRNEWGVRIALGKFNWTIVSSP